MSHFNDDKYEALDKELAQLLGWKNVAFMFSIKNGVEMFGDFDDMTNVKIVRRTQDSEAAFKLMYLNECNVQTEPCNNEHNGYSFHVTCGSYYVQTKTSDHVDAATALRVAIVQAVIANLKGNA